MRSYYTYGAIPDPVRTVRGFDDGGLATVPDYSTWKGDVSSGQGIMDFFNLQRERELGPGALSSFAGPTSTAPVQQGNFSLYNPNERSAAEVAADYAKASGLDLAGFAKSQGMSEADLMSQINKSEMNTSTERGALNEIKSLAGAGDFQGAFEAAKAAEARIPGQDFVSNLVSPESLRYIAPEMDKKDVDNYFDALKNVVGEREYEKRYVGTGNEFDLEEARAKNLAATEQGVNFANPQAGVKAKLDPTVDIISQLALAAIPGIGPLGAAALSGGAKYVTSGGDLKAALTSAALAGAGNYVGGKIMNAVKAPSISDLTGVTTTASRAAQAAAETASTAVANGVAPSLIQEVVVSAARSAAPNLAAGVLNSITNGVLTNLVSRGVQIPKEHLIETQAPEGQAPLSTTAQELGVSDPSNLEEVVVQSLRKAGMPDLSQAFASTMFQGGQQDILTERQMQEAQRAEEQAKAEQDQKDLEEIVMTARRTQPLNIGAPIPALSSQIERFGPSKLVTETTPLEEVTMKARRPQQPDINLGTLAGLTPAITTPSTGEAPLEEVVSTARRPAKPEINLGQLATSPLSELFPRPNVDPFKGKIAPEQPKTQTELDKIQDALATGAAIPGTASVLSKLASGAEKAESLAKAASLIGTALSGLGGGGSGTAGGVGVGTGTGAFGGALPKYTYERQQLSPPIDYYTYGTRPEAKFFEGTYKLAEPTQPEMVPPPSEPSGVVTSAVGGLVDENMTGGLIGYAKGGDAKPERYVDGPGSGRDDKIPAMLSDGEYVIDAETLALLGDGSTKEGARRMDQFRAKIRQHKGRALSRGRISPNAKSPEKYMGGGLS